MEKSIKRNEFFFSLPTEQIRPFLINRERFVLLETQKADQENYLSYLFYNPISIITCFELDKVLESLQRIEEFLNQGYWAAGFFSYEMGYAWEEFKTKRRFSFPLMWIGIFNPPIIFDHRQGKFLNQLSRAFLLDKSPRPYKYKISDLRLNENLARYIKNIKCIKDNIAKGLTYQVNYTIKCKFRFKGASLGLYKDLRDTQPVAYSAFIKDRNFEVLSFSPELFFRKKERLITVRPMKGTISRGRTNAEDRLQVKRLKSSLKDRSENVMIVDLLRNDLGRISDTGSVKTVKLYNVEKYKTLFQMTSTIQARLKKDISLCELFRSLFPSGSVTGAPKIKTTEIIKELENQERRVYTGATGFIAPNKDAVFNVAIRTLLLKGDSGEMGIGSGIVYDSDPEKEYMECRLKALFFTQKKNEFQLIETIRWSKRNGFFLINYHLQRLRSSAEYFNFTFNEERIKQELRKLTKGLDPGFDYRVRLLLHSQGKVSLTYQRLKKEKKIYIPRVAFAGRKIDSQNFFFYHKTTERQIYDQEYKKARKKSFFEVIFENENGHITEGAISNIFIRKGKMFYTPPLSCGLLNGVYRRYFIERNAKFVKEKILTRQDLFQADAVYLTNSVRGIRQVRLF